MKQKEFGVLKEKMRRDNSVIKLLFKKRELTFLIITNEEFVINEKMAIYVAVDVLSKNGKKGNKKICQEIQKKLKKDFLSRQKKAGISQNYRVIVKTENGKDWTVKVRSWNTKKTSSKNRNPD